MDSEVMGSENTGSSGKGATEGATEKGPAQVRSSEVGSSQVSSSQVSSSEIRSSEAAASESKPAEFRPVEAGPASEHSAAATSEPVKDEIKAAEMSAPKPPESPKPPEVPKAPDSDAGAASTLHGAAPAEAAKESPKEPPKETPKEISAEALKPRPGSSLILIPPVTRRAESAQAGASAKAADASASAAAFASARSAKKSGVSKGALLRYGIPAALAFCLFGAGIAAGGQFFGGHFLGGGASTPAATAATPAAPAAAKVTHVATIDQTAELRHLTKKLSDEVHALQARVEAMRSAPSASSDDVRSLKKSIDALRASFESQKAETGATIAVLSSKVDRIQHEASRSQAPGDKIVHTEKPIVTAPITTASVSHPASASHGTAATPVEAALATPATAKPQTQAATPAAEPKKKPEKLLANWVVRDVYRGVALVEGPDGSFEVSRGDPIPGAGTVESIERRNGGWVLVTSRGIVASVRD